MSLLLMLVVGLVLPLACAAEAGVADAHDLAVDLVERADGHKDRALREAKRDIRREARRESGGDARPVPNRRQNRRRNRVPKPAVAAAVVATPVSTRRNYYHPDRNETIIVEHEWSETYAWASNATVTYAETTTHSGNLSLVVVAPPQVAVMRSLTTSSPYSAAMQLHEDAGVMLRALRNLASATTPSAARIRSLLVLEELCHDMADADELHRVGGLHAVIAAMNDDLDHVRASAAWALSTCTQNNPTMQNASVELGVLPVLLHLAAEDTVDVCSRALLALNALLELNEARAMFEEMADAIEVLRRPLVELHENPRATRRALNLAELLVERNLFVWKAQLERLDLPRVVERLMRDHHDFDVRVSAARLTLALDGHPPSI
jgi:hypothetical protein